MPRMTSSDRTAGKDQQSLVGILAAVFAVWVLPLVASAEGQSYRGYFVEVAGRSINLPAPAGMDFRSTPEIKSPGRTYLARFDADSSIRRWISLNRKSELPCFAAVSLDPSLTYDGNEAARYLERHRAEPAVGTRDSAVVNAWRNALASARSGRTGPLPRKPDDMVRIERIDTRTDACLELVYASGSHGLLIGTALLVVQGRVLWLEVYLYRPTDLRELARVRSILVQWVDGVLQANG